jgi:hypothetical protein
VLFLHFIDYGYDDCYFLDFDGGEWICGVASVDAAAVGLDAVDGSGHGNGVCSDGSAVVDALP